METLPIIPWANMGPGLTLMGIALTGTFGLIKAYFSYRVRLIELQNERDHQIEDRRATLEDTRKKTNEDFLSRFQETVKGLREEIQGLKSRIDDLEPKVEAIHGLDKDVQLLSEKVDKANAWFERVKGSSNVKEVAKDVLRVSEGGTGGSDPKSGT